MKRRNLVIALALSGIISAVYASMPSLRHSKEESIVIEFTSFRTFVASHIYESDRAVPPTLHDAMEQWRKLYGTESEDSLTDNPDHCPLLSRGLDPWGTRFLYVVAPKCGLIMLRSHGPDQTDNGGNGDDVQVLIATTAEAMRLTHPSSYGSPQ